MYLRPGEDPESKTLYMCSQDECGGRKNGLSAIGQKKDEMTESAMEGKLYSKKEGFWNAVRKTTEWTVINSTKFETNLLLLCVKEQARTLG